ncbi:MAG: pyridoxamine 5'-phosphate oxidase family protein [Bacteroidales bacterium]|nr:pyridoxamine 5'-phosphate oxidase family protein [Bacteroidales bacterium]MBR4138075.1 pyridoxamine 5'-phosphate oxidase family protein [Bacteroidales bacterium]
MLQKALEFLQEHNEIAFATSDGNLPKVRVFQIMKQEGTTLWFATSAKKDVYKELRQNPNVELLAWADKVSVRCVGKVAFDVNEETKRCIYYNNPVLPRLYDSYDQLDYFSLDLKKIDYYDLRPTPPEMLHFDLKKQTVNGGFVGEKFGMYKV